MSGRDIEDVRLQRLANWVRRERMVKFGSIEEAARRARINRITWNRVERAMPVQDPTYVAVNKVFGLKPGEHETIMAGRAPEYEDIAPEPDPEPDYEPDTIASIKSDDRLTDDDKARLIDLYERMRSDDNGHGRGKRLA